MRKYQTMTAAGLVGLALSTQACGTYVDVQRDHPMNGIATPVGAIDFNCASFLRVYVPEGKKSKAELEHGRHFCLSTDENISIHASTEYDGENLTNLTIKMVSVYGKDEYSCIQPDETICGQAFKAVDDYVNSELDKL